MGTKATWLAVAAGIALSLPALGIGLHDDDFFHRLALSGQLPDYRRDIWSLYEFLPTAEETRRLIERGLVPWFTDPELRTRFFRPLASASLALDVRLFGDWALPAYLQSLLWFSVVLLLVARIHRAILPERAAFWSTLSYAWSHRRCSSESSWRAGVPSPRAGPATRPAKLRVANGRFAKDQRIRSALSNRAPAVGLRVATRGLHAEVEQRSSLGATAVRFELDTELDSSCLVRWAGGADGHFQSFTLPARGELVHRHEPGPLGI